MRYKSPNLPTLLRCHCNRFEVTLISLSHLSFNQIISQNKRDKSAIALPFSLDPIHNDARNLDQGDVQQIVRDSETKIFEYRVAKAYKHRSKTAREQRRQSTISVNIERPDLEVVEVAQTSRKYQACFTCLKL